MKHRLVALIGMLLLLGIGIQHGLAAPLPSTVTFNFFGVQGSGNTNVGTDETYWDSATGSTYSVTAYGFNSSGTDDLIENNRGTNEQGLGVNPAAPGEINNNGEYIKIDLSSFTEAALYGTWGIAFDSVDQDGGGEIACLWSAGPGTCVDDESTDTDLIYSATQYQTGSSFATDKIYYFSNPGTSVLYVNVGSLVYDELGNANADVLLHSLTFINPVPEPSTLLLSGLGLAGVFGYIRRRQSVKQV